MRIRKTEDLFKKKKQQKNKHPFFKKQTNKIKQLPFSSSMN